ncbi:DUF5667 domain-containing protein [Streptomyces sp. NPDC006879]|uniref:DUF5667 domain-containing protein n=1 Tax=Streptomyces sp. NPDC006879 TaxID=3364767 RepID=UPI003676C2C4
MIANVSAHRRANAFAQALEDRTSPDPADTAAEQSEVPAEAAEPDRLLALANALGDVPRPALDPEVKVVQRAQLVAAMEAMLMEGTAQGGAGPSVPEQRTSRGAHRATSLRKLKPRSRWSKGIAAGGLTVGVAAGAFSGVAAASSDALPGDSLYGLKRGMEDLRLGMADGDSDRGEVYLDQASTRLHEARRLMERGKLGDLDHESLGEIRRALSGMRHDVSEGHRLLHEAYQADGSLSPIQRLSSFTDSHRDAWGQLRERLPAQLTDVGDEVTWVFEAIDEEVAPLQELLPKAPDQKRGLRSSSPEPAPRSDAAGQKTSPSPKSSPAVDGSTSPDGKPRSVAPPAEEDSPEGILDGAAGGLLNPPHDDQPEPSPSEPGEVEPDITIPPLLPGILPGLGLNGEDVR